MIPATPAVPEPAAFPEFLRALITTGDVRVEAYADTVLEIDAGFGALLTEIDTARRRDDPNLPPLEPTAAAWAAVTLYRAGQFLLCREVPAETVTAVLGRPCPGERTPRTAYSVDLFFVFLPDLFGLAHQLAPDDPLVAGLRQLAHDWPLSSPGIAAGGVTLESFTGDPALLRLYADRVTARCARDRLDDARLRAVLRADAGLFPDLLPFPSSTYAHE